MRMNIDHMDKISMEALLRVFESFNIFMIHTVLYDFRVLCETVKDFVQKVGTAYEPTEKTSEDEFLNGTISDKCNILNEKLDALLKTLNSESKNIKVRVDPD